MLELVGSQIRSDIYEAPDLIETIKSEVIFIATESMEDITDDTNLYKLINLLFTKLTTSQQQMFITLSVFQGAFTIEYAANVTGETNLVRCKQNLQRLRALSLLEDYTSAIGDKRYAIHPVLHSFAFYLITKNETLVEYFQYAHERAIEYNIEQTKPWNEVNMAGVFCRPEKMLLETDLRDISQTFCTAYGDLNEANEEKVNLLKTTAESLKRISSDGNLMEIYQLLAIMDRKNSADYYKKSLSLAINILGPHPVTATLWYLYAHRQFFAGTVDKDVCSAFSDSYHMFKMLFGVQKKTFMAAIYTGYCLIALQKLPYQQDNAKIAPYFEDALDILLNVTLLKNCTKCYISILHTLAILNLPSSSNYAFGQWNSHRKKYETSIDYLLQAFRLIQNLPTFLMQEPNPTQKVKINCTLCESMCRYRTDQFEPHDYCTILYMMLFIAYQKYMETLDIINLMCM